MDWNDSTVKLLLRVVEGYWEGWHGDAEAPALCIRARPFYLEVGYAERKRSE